MSIYIFVTFLLALRKGIAYDEFDRDCVKEHNKFRAMHRAQPLVWSNSIAADAQKWAEYLAENDKIEHDNETLSGTDQGENIAWFTPPLPKCENGWKPNCITCREIVEKWYDEVYNYDYQEGFVKNDTLRVRHFAQVVWNSSMELGVGTAISKTFGFIAVARYYPHAANAGAETFKKNVFMKEGKLKIIGVPTKSDDNSTTTMVTSKEDMQEGKLKTKKVPTKYDENSTTENSSMATSEDDMEEASNEILPKHMTCGSATARHHGNSSSKIGDFPWVVGLRYQNSLGKSNIFCRGALLSKEWVITAARCVNTNVRPNFKLKVILGEFDDRNHESNEVVIDSENVMSHPLHQNKSNDYDIALIKLKPPLATYTDYMRPICLPYSKVKFSPGEMCAVTGIDGIHGNSMKRVNVTLVSLTDCRVSYDWLTERMICSASKQGKIDTCKGDMGSPLICFKNGKFYLAGIASHAKNCGEAGFPAVYANVKYLIPWISDALKTT